MKQKLTLSWSILSLLWANRIPPIPAIHPDHSFLFVIFAVLYTIFLSQQLLLFLFGLFGILGMFSSLCKCIASLLPSSFYKSPHFRFKRYVVCKKCHHIYFFDDCVHVERGRKISKPCPFIAFPHHPHRQRRLPCSALLLKVASGKTMLYPFMSYCYLSLEVQLQAFLLRPNFYSQCEQWRSKTGTDLSDVMDGRIWKEFQTHMLLCLSPGT